MLLKFTRVWFPLAIALAGVVCIAIGGTKPSFVTDQGGSILSALGVSLLIVAIIVWMINWMFRLSVESNRERDREEEAREYFDRHGRWPDE